MTDHDHAHRSAEELDALLGGDVPEDVSACEQCRARLEALENVRAAIADVGDPAGASRELAIASALAASTWPDAADGKVVPLRRRTGSGIGSSAGRWVAAAAAVVALLAIAGPLLTNTAEDADTAAGLADTPLQESTGGMAAGSDMAALELARDPDLGELDDTAELGARLRDLLPAAAPRAPEPMADAGASGGGSTGEPAADDSQSGGEALTGASTPQSQARDGSAGDTASRCGDDLATTEADLGPVLVRATLRWQGEAAVVVVHERPAGSPALWLYRTEGCELLLQLDLDA